jgi:hypothetical protein
MKKRLLLSVSALIAISNFLMANSDINTTSTIKKEVIKTSAKKDFKKRLWRGYYEGDKLEDVKKYLSEIENIDDLKTLEKKEGIKYLTNFEKTKIFKFVNGKLKEVLNYPVVLYKDYVLYQNKADIKGLERVKPDEIGLLPFKENKLLKIEIYKDKDKNLLTFQNNRLIAVSVIKDRGKKANLQKELDDFKDLPLIGGSVVFLDEIKGLKFRKLVRSKDDLLAAYKKAKSEDDFRKIIVVTSVFDADKIKKMVVYTESWVECKSCKSLKQVLNEDKKEKSVIIVETYLSK